MPIENERKFLVKSDNWRNLVKDSLRIEQLYIAIDPPTVIRIRKYGSQHILSLKSALNQASSFEWEKPLSEEEYEELKPFAKRGCIEKIRHFVMFDGCIWHVDEFDGKHKGFCLAEIEFEQDNTIISLPDWIGEEVTGDLRYNNASLASRTEA